MIDRLLTDYYLYALISHLGGSSIALLPEMGYVQYVANAFSPRLLSIVYCWWKLIGKSARSVMRTTGAINIGCGLVYWVQALIGGQKAGGMDVQGFSLHYTTTLLCTQR